MGGPVSAFITIPNFANYSNIQKKKNLINILNKAGLKSYQKIGILVALKSLAHSPLVKQGYANRAYNIINSSLFIKSKDMPNHELLLRSIHIQSEPLKPTNTNINVESIYKGISKNFQTFIGLIINNVLKGCGNSPENCNYTFIGLGSLGRKEMTRYSDLEFAILVDRELNGTEKEYFKHVSNQIHFNIVLFGETPLAELDIGIDDRTVIKKGFCLDGPQGEMAPNWDDRLIATPQGLAGLQSEENYRNKRILPGELRNAALLCGNRLLLDQYKTCLAKALSEAHRKERALSMLRADADRFDIRLGKVELHGTVLPIKYDLYRFLQLRIEGLALYFRITKRDLWSRIRELRKIEIFSEAGSEQLLKITNLILKLRVAVYLEKQCATEEMSLEKIETFDPSALRKIYRTFLSFGNALEKFIDSNGIEQTSLRQSFHCADGYVGGVLAQYRGDFSGASKLFREEVRKITTYNFTERAEILNYIGNCECSLGKLDKAQKHYELAFYLICKSNLDDLQVIKWYMITCSNLAGIYLKLLDFKEAERLFLECIGVAQYHFKQMQYSAILYSNLGSLYSSQRDFKKATDCFKKALAQQESLEMNHPRTALTLYNKGESLYQIGIQNYKYAMEVFEQSFKIARRINGNFDLLCAHAIKGKALVCFDHAMYFLDKKNKKDYHNKLECSRHFHQEAMTIYEHSSLPNSDDIITQLCNLGVVLAGDKARSYFADAEELIKQRSRTDAARLWKDFYSQQGLAYHHAGQIAKDRGSQLLLYKESSESYKKALNVWEDIIGVIRKETCFESAFRYHQSGTALLRYAQLYRRPSGTRNNKRVILQMFQESLSCLEKALKAYGTEFHPKKQLTIDAQAELELAIRELNNHT